MSKQRKTEDGGQKALRQAQGGTEAHLQAQGGADDRVTARALFDGICALHNRRGELVLRAKAQKAAGEHAAYAATWELVTEISLQIEQAESDLQTLGGRAALLEKVGGLDAKTAAEAAMDLISMISRMPEAEAVKVVNVIEAGLKVLAHGQALKKAVRHG